MMITAEPPLSTFMSSETETWILSSLKYINNNKISWMKWFEQCVMETEPFPACLACHQFTLNAVLNVKDCSYAVISDIKMKAWVVLWGTRVRWGWGRRAHKCKAHRIEADWQKILDYSNNVSIEWEEQTNIQISMNCCSATIPPITSDCTKISKAHWNETDQLIEGGIESDWAGICNSPSICEGDYTLNTNQRWHQERLKSNRVVRRKHKRMNSSVI